MRQSANVLDRERGPMNQETIEAASASVAAQAASKAMYLGALGGVAGGLSMNEILGIFGASIGLAGFLLNWYYKHKHYKLAQEEAAAKMGLYG